MKRRGPGGGFRQGFRVWVVEIPVPGFVGVGSGKILEKFSEKFFGIIFRCREKFWKKICVGSLNYFC